MRIFVQLDFDTGEYELMCESHHRQMPAGPRLFRAPPHPDVQWRHQSLDSAEADASKLRTYLAALTAKRPSKKELREFAA